MNRDNIQFALYITAHYRKMLADNKEQQFHYILHNCNKNVFDMLSSINALRVEYALIKEIAKNVIQALQNVKNKYIILLKRKYFDRQANFLRNEYRQVIKAEKILSDNLEFQNINDDYFNGCYKYCDRLNVIHEYICNRLDKINRKVGTL